MAAVASARRLRDTTVHKDTADHWRQLLDYGRLIERQPCGEQVGELLVELETEIGHVERRQARR